MPAYQASKIFGSCTEWFAIESSIHQVWRSNPAIIWIGGLGIPGKSYPWLCSPSSMSSFNISKKKKKSLLIVDIPHIMFSNNILSYRCNKAKHYHLRITLLSLSVTFPVWRIFQPPPMLNDVYLKPQPTQWNSYFYFKCCWDGEKNRNCTSSRLSFLLLVMQQCATPDSTMQASLYHTSSLH